MIRSQGREHLAELSHSFSHQMQEGGTVTTFFAQQREQRWRGQMAFHGYALTLAKRWLLFFCLFIVTLSGCNGAGGKLPVKTVVLVVPLSDTIGPGPPAENQVLTAQIAPRLREALKDEPRAVVKVLPKPTAPIEDSTEARQVGGQEGAALVLWAKSPKHAPETTVDLYIEILQKPEAGYTLYDTGAQLDELDTLELQAIAVEDIPLEPLVSGLVYYSNGLFEDAATTFEAAKDGFEKGSLPFLEITFLRGNTYYHLGEYQRALQEYNGILSDGTDMPGAYNNRGLAYAMLGQMEEALQDLGKAIEFEPDNALFYNNQGFAYERSWRLRGELERRRELWRLQEAVQSLNKAMAMDPECARAYYNRAATYHAQQQWDRALDDLDRAIEIEPLAGFYFGRADIHSNLGHNEQADEDYSKAIELSRDVTTQARSLYNRALIRYYDLGEHEKGLADFDQAIKLDPGFAMAYRARGAVYWDQERWEEAVQDYSKAIELEPNDAGAYVSRGYVYSMLGRLEDSLQDYDRAIELEPYNAGAYSGRGDAYVQLGHLEEALQDYNKAIELEPDHAGAHSGRGYVYMRLGQLEEALQDYNKTTELEPNYTGAYLNRGYVYSILGRLEDSLQDYDKAIELEPDNARAYWGRGDVYLRLAQLKEALRDYSKAIELEPNDVEAYIRRGNAYVQLEQLEEALKDYDKVIKLEPGNVKAYLARGDAHRVGKQPELALQDYAKALELEPDNVEAYFWRGLIYQELGEKKKAIDEYTKIIELQPDAIETFGVYYNRGMIYDERGQTWKAIRDYEKAIELKPDLVDAITWLALAYEKVGDEDKALSMWRKAESLETREEQRRFIEEHIANLEKEK
jgi:tetratricopeptide (TPR) repeat protein